MCCTVKYVLIQKFCDLTGYTRAAVETKIGRGIWLENKIWIKAPDGHRLISIEGYEAWAEMEAFGKRLRRAMKSPSPIEEKGAEKELNSSPAPLISVA